jgi:hypothetical protein
VITSVQACSVPRSAVKAKDASEARHLLALAAVRNERGPEGLINGKPPRPEPKLYSKRKEELAGIAETGPDPQNDSIVRWRCAGPRRIPVHPSTDIHQLVDATPPVTPHNAFG